MRLRLMYLLGVAAIAPVLAGCWGGAGGGLSGPGDARLCGKVGGGTATVPDVAGLQFTVALRRLLSRHLLVSVRRFAPIAHPMPEQGFGDLASYLVVSQSLPPGTRVRDGRAVALRLNVPSFRRPLGSLAEPAHHPATARVPDLVGSGYPNAIAAGRAFTTGIYVAVRRTLSLTPAASSCGLAGFVVASQTPRPGTRVQWGGVSADGVDPGRATVTITLVSREAAPGS